MPDKVKKRKATAILFRRAHFPSRIKAEACLASAGLSVLGKMGRIGSNIDDSLVSQTVQEAFEYAEKKRAQGYKKKQASQDGNPASGLIQVGEPDPNGDEGDKTEVGRQEAGDED